MRKILFPVLILTSFAYCGSSQKKTFATPSDNLVDAAENGDEKRVAELLAQGVNINQKSSAGYTPLMAAAERGQIKVVNALLAAKADVHALNKFSWNALMLACVGGHAEVAQALITAGANVYYRSPNGETSKNVAFENVDHVKPSSFKPEFVDA